MKLLTFAFFLLLAVRVNAGTLAVPSDFSLVPEKIAVELPSSTSILTLRLPANFSSGYSWGTNEPIEITSKSENFYPGMIDIDDPQLPPLLGGNSVQILTFPPLSQGRHEIKLIYRRPFDPKNPIRETTLIIDVK